MRVAPPKDATGMLKYGHIVSDCHPKPNGIFGPQKKICTTWLSRKIEICLWKEIQITSPIDKLGVISFVWLFMSDSKQE